MGYRGWAVFMDCHLLCRGDIAELWAERSDDFLLMGVQHKHVPAETVKFIGEVQSADPKKNGSSLMLLNGGRCQALGVVEAGQETHASSNTVLGRHRLSRGGDKRLDILIDDHPAVKRRLNIGSRPLLRLRGAVL